VFLLELLLLSRGALIVMHNKPKQIPWSLEKTKSRLGKQKMGKKGIII